MHRIITTRKTKGHGTSLTNLLFEENTGKNCSAAAIIRFLFLLLGEVRVGRGKAVLTVQGWVRKDREREKIHSKSR